MGGPRAVVVGAGIGGLAAAHGLRRVGWDVTVLERAPQLRPVGAGITLFPNAMRALDALGLGDAVRGVAAPPPAVTTGLRSPSGRWVNRVEGAGPVEGMYALHRAALHQVLLAGLPDGTVRTGAEATGLTSGEAGVQVHHAGGTVPADLAVVADGVHSRLRAALLPAHPGPRYAGYTSWRGVTGEPLPVDAAGETWGDGERFGILLLPGGRVYWFATCNTPAGGAAADEHAEVRRRFGHWHDPIPRLLAATAPEAVLRLDIYSLDPPPDSFVLGPRAVLLGDAAHAMTPDLGQGGCQALEDAVTLAACLAGNPDAATALAEYDAVRRPRTRRIARSAARIGRFGQSHGRLRTAVRDTMMRLTPPRAMDAMAARVTAWQPPPLP